MGEAFRRILHSLGRILRASKNTTTNSSQERKENGEISRYDTNDLINSEWMRDQEIITSSSDDRRSVIIEREPTQSFGFSLQSVLVENKDDGLESARITFVSKCEAGSPADKAGIVVGDIIIAIDGEVVVDYSHAELIAVIKSKTRMRVIVIFENMQRKVELISEYAQTEKKLAKKKLQLADVENQIDEILSRQCSEGSQGKLSEDGCFEDSAYSETSRYSQEAASRLSLISVESWNFDEASVHFC